MDKRQQQEQDLARIKLALKQSYSASDKQNPALMGWIRDASLSGNRSQVYASPDKKDVLVVHTGSKTASDWLKTNPLLAVGAVGKSKRGKHALGITKDAVKKYGMDAHITVAGHSLGGGLAQESGRIKGVDEVVTVNKGGSLLGNRPRLSIQTDYRNVADPVSLISGGLLDTRGKLKTSGKLSLNPLVSHSIDSAF